MIRFVPFNIFNDEGSYHSGLIKCEDDNEGCHAIPTLNNKNLL